MKAGEREQSQRLPTSTGGALASWAIQAARHVRRVCEGARIARRLNTSDAARAEWARLLIGLRLRVHSAGRIPARGDKSRSANASRAIDSGGSALIRCWRGRARWAKITYSRHRYSTLARLLTSSAVAVAARRLHRVVCAVAASIAALASTCRRWRPGSWIALRARSRCSA